MPKDVASKNGTCRCRFYLQHLLALALLLITENLLFEIG